MVSTRLIQRIEANWESIVRSIISAVHRDARLQSYQLLDEAELRARAEDLVRNLGYWIASGNEAEIAARYESLGARRRLEGVPLSEVIAKLQLLHEQLLRQVQWQNSARDALDLHSELELTRALSGYFRQVIYSVARGYEKPQAMLPVRAELHRAVFA